MRPSEQLEEAVSFARSHGNLRSVGAWQKTLGGLAIIRGDQARARRLFEESLAIHRGLDDAWGVSHSLSSLSFLALEAGDAETARTLLSEALAIEREGGHQPRLANALEMSARLAAADGDPALAIRLHARAALLRERVRGLTFEVGWPDPTPNLDDLRARVGEEHVRGGVGAWSGDDSHPGHRPGDPGAAQARAGRVAVPLVTAVLKRSGSSCPTRP